RAFLGAMPKCGTPNPPALTAREFAVQVRAAVPEEGIDFITEKFCEARYRGTPPAPAERRRIDHILPRRARGAAPSTPSSPDSPSCLSKSGSASCRAGPSAFLRVAGRAPLPLMLD